MFRDVNNTVDIDLDGVITATDMKMKSIRNKLPNDDLVDLDKEMRTGDGTQADKWKTFTGNLIQKYETLHAKKKRAEDERGSAFNIS
jgi:hypothetical protein